MENNIVEKIHRIGLKATEEIGNEFSKNSGLPPSHPMVQEMATGIGIGLVYKYGAVLVWDKFNEVANTDEEKTKLDDIMEDFARRTFTTPTEFKNAILAYPKDEWDEIIKNDPQSYDVIKEYIEEVKQVVDEAKL